MHCRAHYGSGRRTVVPIVAMAGAPPCLLWQWQGHCHAHRGNGRHTAIPIVAIACTLPCPSQILRLLLPAPEALPYMSKWESIDWKLSISQRLQGFIPPRAHDVLLRIHALTLQVEERIHLNNHSLLCSNCKRPRHEATSSPCDLASELDAGHSPGAGSDVRPPDCDSSQSFASPPSSPSEGWLGCNESLSYCLFDCPSISTISNNLRQTLSSHFSIPLHSNYQLLFAIPQLPTDGFPFTLLSSIAFYHIWIAKCDVKLNSKRINIQSLLHVILNSFLAACTVHFSEFNKHPSRKKEKILQNHAAFAEKHHILTFSSRDNPSIHPRFRGLWLTNQQFDPP